MPAAGTSILSRLRARLRGEGGFTLPELMVVVALVPLVLIAMLKMLDTSTQLVPRSVQYADAVQESGNGTARIIRDLRQSYRIIGTTPNSVHFLAHLNGVDTEVNVSCDITGPTPSGAAQPYRRCVRTAAVVGSPMPAPESGAVVVDRLLNGTTENPVFTFTPDAIFPTYVRMHVQVPSKGEGTTGFTHPITIDNGTLIRNAVLGT